MLLSICMSILMDQFHYLPQLNLQQKRDLICLWLSFKKRCKSQLIVRILTSILQHLSCLSSLCNLHRASAQLQRHFTSNWTRRVFSMLNLALHQEVLLQEVFLSKKFLRLLLLVELTSMQSIHSQRSTRHTLFALCVAQVKRLSTKMKSQLIWLQRTLEMAS